MVIFMGYRNKSFLLRVLSFSLSINVLLSQCFTMTVVAASREDGNSSSSSSTSASFSVDNDGKFREAGKVYGDSGIAPSFKDCDYYDCYVPYAQTCEEVGGFATSMSSSSKNSFVGDFINYENDMFHFSTGDYWTLWNEGGTEGYEADTGLATLTDANGTVYYVSAFPHWLWNYSESFYRWGFQGKGDPAVGGGEIVDIILTDGTCIHFIFGDAKADEHTNGGAGTSHSSDTYSFDNTNLGSHSHYSNMYQAMGGEIVEIWGKSGSHSKFWNKYNFNYTTGEGNHIAYIRMYNKKISDNPQPASSECKNVSYKATNGTKKGTSSNSGEGAGISGEFIEEGYFVPLSLLQENTIALPTEESLSVLDKDTLMGWRQDIENRNANKVISYERAIVMLLGILLCVYGIFLYVAFHFDSVNNILDISLLSILTFGRLYVSPDGEMSTWGKSAGRQSVTHTNIMKIVFVTELVGVLIASGKMYSIILAVINFVQKCLSGLT